MELMNDVERQKFSEFVDKHIDCYKKYGGYVSMRLDFNWDNGIGVTITAKCNNCGTIKNITDYDTW